MALDKRYQVFVSSTYADLKEERQKVMQTLMEMDCFPAGMELFPAADEEQWEFIKRVIDDCDYYLLIIGGRYGTTTADGVSYTEKEYQYAIEKGLKVIAFLHDDPEALIVSKTDRNTELAERLGRFRSTVQQGRLVKYWKSAEELPGLVALSLQKTIKTWPAVGWVRANRAASAELLEQMELLRKENADLRTRLSSQTQQETVAIPDIAGLDDLVEMHLQHGRYGHSEKTSLTWGSLFSAVAPVLLERPADWQARNFIATALSPNQDNVEVEDRDFQTIKVQFKALGLIELVPHTSAGVLWVLTSKGEATMLRLRAVRKTA